MRVRSQALQPIGDCRGLPTIASLYDVFDVLFVASALTYLATAAFAIRVAIWGDTVFAGAPGRATVYEFLKPEDGWKTTSRFDRELRPSGKPLFGQSLALRSKTLVISGLTGYQLSAPAAAFVFGR